MSYPADHRLQDVQGRQLRARRIQRILEVFGGIRLEGARVLDLGASHLLISRSLSECGADVVGLDVDQSALGHGMAEAETSPRLCAVAGSGMSLPFADAVFDVVVCNHVYEHVPDPHTLLSEIKRVLREGGVCYFAGGHKYQLIEPHYRLPFLSWLSTRWADRCLAAVSGHKYDIHFLTQPGIRKLLAVFDDRQDITADMLRRAVEFKIAPAWIFGFLAHMPRPLASFAARVSPTHVWLLRK